MRNHVHGTCLRRDRQAQHSQVTGWGARYSLSSEAGGLITLQPEEISRKELFMDISIPFLGIHAYTTRFWTRKPYFLPVRGFMSFYWAHIVIHFHHWQTKG